MDDAITQFLDEHLGSRNSYENYADYIRWFANKSQDYWVFAARHWVWDNGTAPFWWMINQPECSIAVAAHIFWNGGPEFYGSKWDDERHRNSEVAQLLNRICELETTRGFVASDLSAMIGYDLSEHLLEVETFAISECPFKQVPPRLVHDFGSRLPIIDPSDHPASSAYAYDIFNKNDSCFGRRPEMYLDRPFGWPEGGN